MTLEKKSKPAASKKRAPASKPRAAAKPRASTTRRRAPKPEERVADKPLSVLMVTSEAHPFAKTGGLAEVSAALPQALSRLGHRVSIVLPRYKGIAVDDSDTRPFPTTLTFGERQQAVTIFERTLSEHLTVAFIDVPELFDRDGLYGNAAHGDFPDNALRFAVLSRAALEYPRLRRERPSVIHAHDWQAGLVPVYQKLHLSADPIVGGVPTVFTIHNLAFQGVFPPSTLPTVGLGPEALHIHAMEFWGNVSYLKGGINFSEKITTVSPNYAKEILRPELGFGFEGVLARRAHDLVGILNGIDVKRWNPVDDPFVPASFSADDVSGKRDAKRALLEAAKLPATGSALERPVVGLVSRLTDQKGFDLISAAAGHLMNLDATWVMLGSGERKYEDFWRTLAAGYPDRVSATIGFDERLAHLIEAGSDMFLMASRFEPCGLNQLYSLRYGTVPIVRGTGGLEDTVEDVDSAPAGRGTGFKFYEYLPGALVGTVRRALEAFGDNGRWKQIQERGMRLDHSWDVSAREYVKVYRGARTS